MIPYQTKIAKLSGTSYGEVLRKAQFLFDKVEKRTKRRPYIRSAYFKKEKVFFDFFWLHVRQKRPRERFQRLKYFGAALELIRLSKNDPSSKPNPNKTNEILHRFAGLTKEKELFYVQIKERRGGGKKYLMSCFPPE